MIERLAALTYAQALIIGLILGGAYYTALYNNGAGLEASLATAKSQYENLQNEIKKINIAIKDADRFKLAAASLGQEIEAIQMALPTKFTSLDLMKIISTEAKSVGVDINQLSGVQNLYQSNKKSDEPKYYETIQVNLELGGNYNQIMLFLANLTKLDKIITANELKLTLNASSASAKENQNPRLKLTVRLNGYKYITEEVADAPKSKQPAGATK